MTTTLEISWLAGLLEGEGCFSLNNKTVPRIQLTMTDKDTIERVAKLMKPVSMHKYDYSREGLNNRKPIFGFSLYGTSAVEWMLTLYTLLGERRRQRIDGILTVWKNHKKLIGGAYNAL